ncbi:phosphoserine phosphatase [Tribonema minus]|uniref:phosphoserine phosphatase n=1 Tax=Tribonema minus TaxID=303371 RepID=A0A835ZG36_9STRA|nr:phosphoserine phosphatase [Tribonema minus]
MAAVASLGRHVSRQTYHHRAAACRAFASTSSNRAPAPEGINVQAAKRALASAQAVCFDVDSTVCTEEGIDVLAGFCGAAEAVAEMTKKAMGGNMLFQDAIRMRLELMRPSTAIVERCLREHPPQLSPGMADLAAALHERGTDVYLVSGGFRSMIYPVAKVLGIPESRVYANTIMYNADGSYQGFDEQEPTSRDGGKPAVVKALKAQHGYAPVVMVGDGVTDMQARPPAEAFIGYGGVAVRDAVRRGADWYVYDFQDMIEVVRGGAPRQ